MSKRGSRCSHDLQERVCVFSSVVVVLASSVDLLDIARQEIFVALLRNNILFNAVEDCILDPPESNGGGVPWTRGRLLLRC